MFRKISTMLILALVSLTLCGFSAPGAGAEEGGNPWWIWILVLLALVLFVAVVLWWWMRSSGEEEEELASEVVRSHVGAVEEAETKTQPPRPPTISSASKASVPRSPACSRRQASRPLRNWRSLMWTG